MINSVFVKSLVLEDVDVLFKLRNLPDIVSLSASQKVVSYKEHVKWLHNSLLNKNKFMFLIFVKNDAAGFVSFEKEIVSRYTISLYLTKNYRGEGIGKQSYFEALSYLPIGPKFIVAKVRKDNVGSQRFFLNSGFVTKEEKKEIILMEKAYD